MTFFLFGSPTGSRSAANLFALPFERRNQLLVFLALRRAWVGRTELAAMFWPDQQSKLAYTNLRKILYRVQSLPMGEHRLKFRAGALRFRRWKPMCSAFESALRETTYRRRFAAAPWRTAGRVR